MIQFSGKYDLTRLAVLLLWCMAASAFRLSAQPLQPAFHHLGRDKGLSQGWCPYVSRDSKGFVWIGSVDGLNRYDGRQIRVYRPTPFEPHGLVGNVLTSPCYEDAETGDLWFTTYNAIHRYAREYDHFDTFQLHSPARERLVEDYYAFHLDREGRLWLRVGTGDNGYLHLFDTRRRRDSIVCPLGGARSIVVGDKNGVARQVLCSEFPNGGLEIVDVSRGFTRKTYLREGPSRLAVHETFAENDTLVWLGMSNGIAAFNPQNGAYRIYSRFDDDPAGDVWSVHPYKESLLFVATKEKGLWVFDRKSRQFTRRFVHEPDNPFSLPDNEVENLYIDPEDNLWAGHWKYGLSYMNLQKNKFYIPPGAAGSARSFWKIQKGPDGNVWCGESGKGVFIYTAGGRFVDTLGYYFQGNTRKPLNSKRLIFLPGTGFCFHGKNLLKWDGIRRQLRFVREIPVQILSLVTSPKGKTIATTANGLFFLSDEGNANITFTPVDLPAPAQPANISAVFCDSRGYMYLSSNFERLFIFKENPEGFDFVKTAEGIGECKSFLELPGAQGAWIAGTAGLLRISPNLDTRMLNEAQDGLPNATYYGVAPDRQGRLWLSSNQGLLRYDPARDSVNRYLPIDGLFGYEFNTGSFYQAPDGKIWAGGIGGLAVFHPDSIGEVPFRPRVQITQILVNDMALDSAKQVEVLESLDMPYTQNTLSFEFVALEFSNPAANTFKYRMAGYDDKWVESGVRGFARYANLPPGDYTFEVLAANSDGVWSKTPKQMLIHIRTPFYMAWWFYLLCALTAAGLIYSWFRYRLEQALKIERMRVQISSDLHDDVGTLLSGLAMQSEVLELTAPEKDKSKLRRIGEISRDAMARMRDTVWAIDARKDKLENLLDRMREHAEETLTPRGMRFSIEAEHLNTRQNLPTHFRQNLYLIYKEAVTNAAKHSNGDTVWVSLKKSGAGFEMRIRDNGTAAEKAWTTTGSGTGNMQMRAEKIGGTLEIGRENGFCVTLRVKSTG